MINLFSSQRPVVFDVFHLSYNQGKPIYINLHTCTFHVVLLTQVLFSGWGACQKYPKHLVLNRYWSNWVLFEWNQSYWSICVPYQLAPYRGQNHKHRKYTSYTSIILILFPRFVFVFFFNIILLLLLSFLFCFINFYVSLICSSEFVYVYPTNYDSLKTYF